VGLFKDMKNMKDMVNSAPETIATAQQMGAQAQELAAAQQAAAAAQMASFQAPGATPGAPAVAGGPDFEPVAGVSLELYAEISRELAASGYDQAQAAQLAASKGVSAENWQAALDGWNGRMKTNPAVGQQFNRLYTAG
jgi:hypothetical protein